MLRAPHGTNTPKVAFLRGYGCSERLLQFGPQLSRGSSGTHDALQKVRCLSRLLFSAQRRRALPAVLGRGGDRVQLIIITAFLIKSLL